MQAGIYSINPRIDRRTDVDIGGGVGGGGKGNLDENGLFIVGDEPSRRGIRGREGRGRGEAAEKKAKAKGSERKKGHDPKAVPRCARARARSTQRRYTP